MKPYKYKLERDYVYPTGVTSTEIISVIRDGKLWAQLQPDGNLVISQGYAWDGCSPKFSFLDLFLFGTPDGCVNVKTMKPKTYYASLVHDALYQFREQFKKAIPRKKADQIFLQIMKENGFKLRYIYYFAVRLFGGIPYSISGKW